MTATTAAKSKSIEADIYPTTWQDIGGDAVSLITFLIWFVQIVRSMILYYRFGAHKKRIILEIHAILIIANILYFCYELIVGNQNPSWLIFTMKYLLNISVIFSHQLINTDQYHSHLHKYFTGAKFLVTGIFIGGLFAGHWGIMCDHEHMPKGVILMTGFSIIWTIFVIYQFRSDDMMRKGGFTKIIKNSAQMALDSKEKEFDHDAMKADQQKMYVLLQIAILFFEILIPLQMLGLWAWDEVSDSHMLIKGKCVFDHPHDANAQSFYTKDSFVTQMLNCVAFSLPLQQFISCFYVIPQQYNMFSAEHANAKDQGSDSDKEMVEGGPKMEDQEAEKPAQDSNTIQ